MEFFWKIGDLVFADPPEIVVKNRLFRQSHIRAFRSQFEPAFPTDLSKLKVQNLQLFSFGVRLVRSQLCKCLRCIR